MKTDPAFQRTRENGMEFGHNAKMGQLVRNSAVSLLRLAKDYRVSSRLSQTMSVVKNLDLVSARGARKVANGLQSVEGKKALKGFDFNQRSSFKSVFKGVVALDTATGVVTLSDFNPDLHLALPEGATHASLSSAVSLIDFEEVIYSTSLSNKENFPVTDGTLSITLTPSTFPTGTGHYFYFFLIEFFQEINGVQYPLKNNAYNVLTLLEVL